MTFIMKIILFLILALFFPICFACVGIIARSIPLASDSDNQQIDYDAQMSHTQDILQNFAYFTQIINKDSILI